MSGLNSSKKLAARPQRNSNTLQERMWGIFSALTLWPTLVQSIVSKSSDFNYRGQFETHLLIRVLIESEFQDSNVA